MKVLYVHPSSLMYSEVYLRLEPLGLELVAQASRRAGHQVRLLDLQADRHADYYAVVENWRPDAIGFSLNYLANIPEVIDLARRTRRRFPDCFIFAGGHSASFTAKEILEHAQGAIDCVVRGEGEEITPVLLEAQADDRSRLHELPGIVTLEGEGPPPRLIRSLDDTPPARELLRRRWKYFIGVLDPCASIEFARGCPWNCTFCSAWTFYGRSYRRVSPEAAAEDLARIREPGVFIVDDVAFVHAEHGHAIAEEVERRGIRKQYYLETRCDVLLKNRDVFERWRALGLKYMFLGLEAIDEEGLKLHRKRVTLNDSFAAVEYARSIGLTVAVNIIADPSWDERRFEIIREWALSVPEIVHVTVNTPYPGTETWVTESRRFTTRDYRLFDVQHAVLPTRLPLRRFYEELVRTQQVLATKHMGWVAFRDTLALTARLLARGQTNFARMLWKFAGVYNVERLLRDHARPTVYAIRLPERRAPQVDARTLYIHRPGLVSSGPPARRPAALPVVAR
ncbi:MAG: B12-binding domain-containing radical SAM protein [Planctomycetota bacterium]|nr:MAG: B12-binding domain-containing radical SAM protein [Planctomycetota bacterium]